MRARRWVWERDYCGYRPTSFELRVSADQLRLAGVGRPLRDVPSATILCNDDDPFAGLEEDEDELEENETVLDDCS